MTYKEERPWGRFETLFEEKNLKVKRITVKPDQRLSLQSHEHRSENWIIIQGEALLELDNKKIFLSENQTAYIPKKSKHRISNYNNIDLIFIEIQRGNYLGEDDITRYEDDYNRV